MYNSIINKSFEWKSNLLDCIRDGMPMAESILYKKVNEVHPGADFVRRLEKYPLTLAKYGSSRYLYEIYEKIYGWHRLNKTFNMHKDYIYFI